MVTGPLRTVLWILGGLAVVWLVSGLAMLPSMGRMMESGGMMRDCPMMQGGMGEGGMMQKMGAMTSMMTMMAAQLLAMLGLLGVLVYLVVDRVRRRPA